MKIAVVTGASSGIGREFARQLDRKGCLDELWVIARREPRLQELKHTLRTAVRPIPLDLLKPESTEYLAALLAREKPDVRFLICASGFAKIGTFQKLSSQEINDMMDLNCKAAVNVTMAVLPYMGKHARILEICSAAAFQPLPGLGVYAATKAFLYSFTRALRWELMPRHIKVTAVCPDWVDTEFIGVAQDTGNPGGIRHFPFAVKPGRVAARALFDSALGLPVSTCSVAFLHRLAAKLLPHEVLIFFWELLRRI